MEHDHKAMRLVSLIIDEINWLSECPFRHGEYFEETAAQTLKDQKAELVRMLIEEGEDGAIIAERVREMQNPNFEFPEGHDEEDMLEEIRMDMGNLA